MSVPARRSDCVGILWKNKIKSLSQPRMSRRRQIHSSAVKRWPKWMVRRCCRNWIKVELTHFCGEDDGIAIFHPKKLFFSRVLICLNWFCRFFSVSHSEAINVHFSLFIIPARPTGDMFRMRWVQSAVCVWCGWVAWWQSTIWLMESSFGHTFIGSNCCIYPAFFFFYCHWMRGDFVWIIMCYCWVGRVENCAKFDDTIELWCWTSICES